MLLFIASKRLRHRNY